MDSRSGRERQEFKQLTIIMMVWILAYARMGKDRWTGSRTLASLSLTLRYRILHSIPDDSKMNHMEILSTSLKDLVLRRCTPQNDVAISAYKGGCHV